MDEEERKARIEEAASAWRPSSEEGVPAHPAWEELDEAGRIEAFEIAQSLRKMEAALDPDALSTTGRLVLERVKQQTKADVVPANAASLDQGQNGDGRPARESETGFATVISFPRRFMQSQPWAMAAVALLVVGVSAWAVRERHGPGTGATDQEQLASVEEQTQERAESEDTAKPSQSDEVRKQAEERVEVAETKPQKAPPVERRRRTRRKEPPRRESGAVEEPRDEAPSLAVKESPAKRDEPKPEQERPELEAFAKGSPRDNGSAKALSGGEQAAGATEQERKICRARVSVVEKLLSQNKDYEPVPEEQLAVGRCYNVLGRKNDAKRWLERAARHPETKARAEEALRGLDAQ